VAIPVIINKIPFERTFFTEISAVECSPFRMSGPYYRNHHQTREQKQVVNFILAPGGAILF
jgi:hypothetical protein